VTGWEERKKVRRKGRREGEREGGREGEGVPSAVGTWRPLVGYPIRRRGSEPRSCWWGGRRGSGVCEYRIYSTHVHDEEVLSLVAVGGEVDEAVVCVTLPPSLPPSLPTSRPHGRICRRRHCLGRALQ